MSKLHNFLYIKIALAFLVGILSTSAISEIFQRGDLAPLGAPDGQLNAADTLILQRMVLGDIQPSINEKKIGDVAPLGNVDGVFNAGDLVILQRAVLGEITLGVIDISSLQPPTLIAGTSPTNDNPYSIMGTATPDTLINIYVEGLLQQTVMSQPNGTFTVNAYLFDGFNSIYAAETDGTFSSLASNTLQVQYNNIINRNTLPTNITVNTVWTPGASNEPYVFNAGFTIDANATLVIQPGTEIKFTGGTLQVDGLLEVRGTPIAPVIFTSGSVPKFQDWTGINILSTLGTTKIDNAIIEYAITGLTINTGASINVTNSIIRNNQNRGIIWQVGSSGTIKYSDITANNAAFTSYETVGIDINRNNIYGNNFNSNLVGSGLLNVRENWWGTSSIGWAAGFDISPWLDAPSPYGNLVNANILLPGDVSDFNFISGESYYALGTISVPVGTSLVIPEDVTINFQGGSFDIYGSLSTTGASGKPVIFKLPVGFGPTISNWGGVNVFDSATNVVLDYVVIDEAFRNLRLNANSTLTLSNCEIKNNTSSGSAGGIVLENNASLDMTGCSIHDNRGNGITYSQGGQGSITGNSIINNGGSGIRLNGSSTIDNNPVPIITGNDIYGNSSSNISAGNFYSQTYASTVVNATGNWWGSFIIPTIIKKISDLTDDLGQAGQGYQPIVDFSAFLDGPIPNGLAALTSANTLYTIDADRTLLPNTTYHVLGHIIIPANVTLTVSEGTKLLFYEGNAGLEIDGTLVSLGTKNNPAIFTSGLEFPTKFSWKGILINNAAGNVTLDNIVIDYANNAILLNQEGAQLTLNNSKLSNSNNGILTKDGSIVNASGNDISGNTYGVRIRYSAPFTTGATVNLTNNDITLNNYGVYVTGISSTPQDPIVTATGNNIYNNVIYNFYTSAYYTATVQNTIVDATGNWWGTESPVEIVDKIFDQSDNVNTIFSPTIDFSGYLDALAPYGVPQTVNTLVGTLLTNRTLNTGEEYEVYSELTVPQGIILTIQPGVILKFPKGLNDSTGPGITVDGTLIIAGTQANPVIFTSSEIFPAKGDWRGITINPTASAVSIDYAIIEYAEYGIEFNDSGGTVSNSLIQHNNFGIWLREASNPFINGNTIIENTTGIWVRTNNSIFPQPIINNNDIYNNSSLQLLINGFGGLALVLDATNNWWGTPTPQLGIDIIDGNSIVDFSSPASSNLHGPAISGLSISEIYVSPNNDGIQETTTLSATIAEPVSWQISVKSSSNVVVRSFSGTGTAINQPWDGKNASNIPVPDGSYTFVISASSSGGVAFTRSISVTIDATFPDATFDAGLDGSTLSNTNVASIIGTAADNLITSYKVEYGIGNTPTSWILIEDIKPFAINNAPLVNWQFGTNDSLPNGAYTLRLTVVDKGGNISTDIANVSINYLAISGVNYAPQIFSPSVGETVTVDFTLGQPATVHLRLYNESTPYKLGDNIQYGVQPGTDLVTERIVIFNSAGPQSIVWDGLDLSDNQLPDEAYRFELYATNATGSTLYSVPVPDNLSNLSDVSISSLDFVSGFFYLDFQMGPI